MICHIEKGCYEDPYNNMLVAKSNEIYSDLYYLRAESMVEGLNRLINQLTVDISIMIADLLHKNVWLHFTRSNMGKQGIKA